MRIVTPATVASAAAMTAFDVAMMTLDITMKAAAASLAFEGSILLSTAIEVRNCLVVGDKND